MVTPMMLSGEETGIGVNTIPRFGRFLDGEAGAVRSILNLEATRLRALIACDRNEFFQ